MTDRPDTGTMHVTEDLNRWSTHLAKLATDYRMEQRSWTLPEARDRLGRMAADVSDASQRAALEATRGDYWSRLDALHRAEGFAAAAELTLARWWQQGELWNHHSARPIPASVQRFLEAQGVGL